MTASSIVLRARALIADEIVPDVLVEVTGGRISDVRPVTSMEAAPANAVAVNGVLVPGFVDVHTHGGGGGAFTGLDPEAAAAAARHQHSRARPVCSPASSPSRRPTCCGACRCLPTSPTTGWSTASTSRGPGWPRPGAARKTHA